MTTRTDINDIAGLYGRAWKLGILLEHIGHLIGTGTLFLRYDAEGFASIRQGDTVIPVACGDIIEIPTEDGPITGRCGLPVHRDVVKTYGSCEGHAGERQAWEAMTEREKAHWERSLEDA